MTKQLADSGKRLSDRQLERASGTQVGVETLRTIVVFCGVGLDRQPRDTPHRETIGSARRQRVALLSGIDLIL
jgi:hypothetical protein